MSALTPAQQRARGYVRAASDRNGRCFVQFRPRGRVAIVTPRGRVLAVVNERTMRAIAEAGWLEPAIIYPASHDGGWEGLYREAADGRSYVKVNAIARLGGSRGDVRTA